MSSTQDKASFNPDLEHRHGEQYSGRRKIPTVQKFNEDERRKREEARRQEAISVKKGLSRVVKDPITGGRVQIQDSNGDYKKAFDDMAITVPRNNVPNAQQEKYPAREFNSEGQYLSEIQNDPSSDQHEHHFGKFLKHSRNGGHSGRGISGSQSLQSLQTVQSARRDDQDRQRHDDDQTAANDDDGWVDIPMRGQRSNILFYTMPDPDFNQHHENMVKWYMRLPYFIFACECFRYFVLDFGRLTSILMSLAAGYWIKEQMDISWRATKLDAVKRRADQALAKRVPESAEWLNSVIEAVWKQINPDIFVPIIDKLEDIMQASAPGIVHAVKVADLGHGDHAVRLLSMRYLEDKEMNIDVKDSDDMQSGEFVNIEVTVAYSAKASISSAASKVKNMHLLIVFYGGLSNVLGVPLPIFTEIEGFIATLRLRLQFTPEFPYIKNTTFSLMGLPNFDISVVPLSQKLLNISNLPIISTFVKKSIKAALNEYNAPKSYTIDLGSIICSDGVPYETLAIGVIVVHIHRATGLEAQDTNGLSDPYIVVAMSNYGKALFSSRIIEKSINPVFEETCFVLVSPESLRSKERLSLQLWDSDRVSADDEDGRVEFDIQDLVANVGHLDDREDGLISSVEGKSMSGSLTWTVGYFSKRPVNRDLATDGSDPNLSDRLKDVRGVASRRALPDLDSAPAVTYCPPDPDWPSGILRIRIHLATDLFAHSPHGSWQPHMQFKQGKDTSAPEIEADEAESPNAYCNIMLNDQLIYRTRTKPFSNKPYFNAGTERFVRDWRSAVCLVAVYDKRTREHDALLGVIPLRLSDVFQNASQVSKIYPSIGGCGEGRLKISLIWESIEHKLPRHLLGWDIGKVLIKSSNFRVSQLTDHGSPLKHMKLKVHTSVANKVIGGKHCRTQDESLCWAIKNTQEEPFELPCVRRHSSAICFEFQSTTRMNTYAVATFWLSDILDDDPQTLRIQVWRTDTEEKRCFVRQNRFDHDKHRDLSCIGNLEFDAVFLRGLGDCYDVHIRSDSSLRQAHEAWSAALYYARRNAGDSYLVSKSTDGHESGLLAPDPYARLNENILSEPSSRDHADLPVDSQEQMANNEVITDHNKEHSLPKNSLEANQSTLPISESQSSMADHCDASSWSNSPTARNPPGRSATTQELRGSLAMPQTKFHSAMFSDYSAVSSTQGSSKDKSLVGDTKDEQQSAAHYKTMKKQQLHREQRGSQQFKTFRTLKWAKDGLVLSKEKIISKMGRSQMRRPDIESEV